MRAAIWVVCWTFYPILALAQDPPRAEVERGSVGNKIAVEVSNRGQMTVLEGVALAVETAPAFVERVSIEPERIDELAPGETREVVVRFDVGAKAQVGASELFEMRVSAMGDSAEEVLDHPRIELQVEAAGATIDEPEESFEWPTILRLERIVGPESGHYGSPFWEAAYDVVYRAGDVGYSARFGDLQTVALEVTQVPLEIVLGESFEVGARLRARFSYPPGPCVTEPRAGNPMELVVERTTVLPPSRLSWSRPLCASGASRCDLSVMLLPGGVEPGDPEATYPCHEGWADDDAAVELTVRFVPEPATKGIRRREFRYRQQVVGDGVVHRSATEALLIFSDLFDVSSGTAIYRWSFNAVEVGFCHDGDHNRSGAACPPELELHYAPVEGSVDLGDFHPPPELFGPRRDGSGEGDQDQITDVDPDESEGADEGGISDSPEGDRGRETGTDSTRDGPGDDGSADSRGDPRHPASLDPSHRSVAALILRWIRVAEPPPNAIELARFHFTVRGAMAGTTYDGGIIGADHEAGLPFDPEFLWTNKRRLDSVDHCTMEEFVASQLLRESIAHCAGRYPRAIAIPDLRGEIVQTAMQRLRSAGLEGSPLLIGPAPSRDLEHRVQSQDQVDRPVPRGTTVNLRIFSDYEPPLITVPDLAGRTPTEARGSLERLGLSTSSQLAGPAPSLGLSSRVAVTLPQANAQVEPGSTVILSLYSDYEPPEPPRPDPPRPTPPRPPSPSCTVERAPSNGADYPAIYLLWKKDAHGNELYRVVDADSPSTISSWGGWWAEATILGRFSSHGDAERTANALCRAEALPARPESTVTQTPPGASDQGAVWTEAADAGATRTTSERTPQRSRRPPRPQRPASGRSPSTQVSAADRVAASVEGERARRPPRSDPQDCDWLILMVKLQLQNAARPNNPGANLARMMAAQLATQARSKGCDESEIAKILDGGTGGDDGGCRCPAGYVPVTAGGTCQQRGDGDLSDDAPSAVPCLYQ